MNCLSVSMFTLRMPGRRWKQHKELTKAESVMVFNTMVNSLRKMESLFGSDEKLRWKQEADKLIIEKPVKVPNDIALVFKIIY